MGNTVDKLRYGGKSVLYSKLANFASTISRREKACDRKGRN